MQTHLPENKHHHPAIMHIPHTHTPHSQRTIIIIIRQPTSLTQPKQQNPCFAQSNQTERTILLRMLIWCERDVLTITWKRDRISRFLRARSQSILGESDVTRRRAARTLSWRPPKIDRGRWDKPLYIHILCLAKKTLHAAEMVWI